MKTIKHTNILILIATLLTNLTVLSMEKDYPQLQLQTKKALPIIYGELSIKKHIPRDGRGIPAPEFAHLATERERKNINKTIGVLSSINTPFIPVTVSVKQLSNNNTTTHSWSNWPIPVENTNKSIARFPSSVPAELLWNLSTGSILNLTVHGYPVKLQCYNNTAIDNKEFHEQFTMYMENFYHQPFAAKGYCPEHKLTSAGVLTLAITNTEEIANNENAIPFYSHQWGPNGCPNEEHLVEMMAAPRIEPYNKSKFQFVMARQYGNKKSLNLKLQQTTSEETQSLLARHKKLERDAD